MRGQEEVYWCHSIDLGNGVVTRGVKSFPQLEDEFRLLGLDGEQLNGARVLDIGCSDGFMSLKCERLGAHVVSIDGVYRDGLKFVQSNLAPKFRYYCMDMMGPSFYELGRFDVVLYLGVLYHTMYPFEHFIRLATACAPNAKLFMETEYYNLPGFEDAATIFFDYGQKLSPDPTSPVFPSIPWIEQTLIRVGFRNVTLLARSISEQGDRGRLILSAEYAGHDVSPFLFAGEQAKPQ